MLSLHGQPARASSQVAARNGPRVDQGCPPGPSWKRKRSSRLRTGALVADQSHEALLLLHAPEDSDWWGWIEERNVGANGGDAVPLAKRDVGDDLRVEHLRLGRNPLLLRRIGRARIGVAHFLHGRIARPAGARLLAVRGKERRHQRIEEVDLNP